MAKGEVERWLGGNVCMKFSATERRSDRAKPFRAIWALVSNPWRFSMDSQSEFG
jgi:hypothetical protein